MYQSAQLYISEDPNIKSATVKICMFISAHNPIKIEEIYFVI